MAQIELVPGWSPSSVVSRINSSLERSDSLRASIAYWTVSASDITSALPCALRRGQGFACVDVHLPTNIDNLADLVRLGADVYLYCEKVKGVPHARHLLHTKLLLFEDGGGQGEIWIGSHNWTRAALGGLNIEASLVVTCAVNDQLYKDAESLLNTIRNNCERFDLTKIEYYKWLQGEPVIAGAPLWSLELHGKSADNVAGTAIALFGQDVGDMSDVRPLREVVVTIFDDDTHQAFNYSGRIFHSGPLERFDRAAAGLSLSRRRYAIRYGSKIPLLLAEEEIPASVMKGNTYFVTIAVETLQSRLVGYDLGYADDAWAEVASKASSSVGRMTDADVEFVFGAKRPRVYRPAQGVDSQPKLPRLEDRLKEELRPLLIKKLFREM